MRSLKLAVAALFFAGSTLGAIPAVDHVGPLAEQKAEAGFQWSCAVSFVALLTFWSPTSTAGKYVVRIGLGAAGIYGYTCPTNLSSYPHGRCIRWDGPRGRCGLYEDGYSRFYQSRYTHTHAWS